MRLPRFILNPSVAGWIRLLQRERKENHRLRLELREWQNKFLAVKSVAPLFQPPQRIESVPQPPIGISAKRRVIAAQPSIGIKTAEEILAEAERAVAR